MWGGGLNEFMLDLRIGVFGGVDLNFLFIFDKFSVIFSLFVLLISSVVFMYMDLYMGYFRVGFVLMVILFIFSMLVLIYFPGMIGLIVGWDGLGITSFLLVFYYGNMIRLKSRLITIFSNRLGDVFMIISFYFL